MTMRQIRSHNRLRGTLLVTSLLLGGQGCASCGQRAVCSQVGINDPENLTMRRQLLAFGTGETCKEMLARNAPLKLSEDAPIIGRFFPRNCVFRELPGGNLVIQFEGDGYGWTNVSRKLTFTSGATVEYSPDFRCSNESAIYAYFPARKIERSQFQLRTLEVGNVAGGLLGGFVTPVAESFARQMVSGKLSEGFTVIRNDDGNIEFGIGIIPAGQHPTKPFKLASNGKLTYENARVEVHQGQRDFIGPIVIRDSGQAIALTLMLDGAPGLDVMLLGTDEAQPALAAYIASTAAPPMPPARVLNDVLVQGRPYKRSVPVRPGTYYVVLDHTATAGGTSPPNNVFDERGAVVSYAVQIGDAS